MIYELYGLPGSGKTTICNIVQKKYKLNNPMRFFKNNFWGKCCMHLFWYLYSLNNDLKSKKNQILKILGNINVYKNCINPNLNINRYIDYLMFVYFVEKKSFKKNIIIDEGIVHYCLALYAEFDVEIEKLERIIKELDIQPKFVMGLKCNILKTFEQIKKRNRKETPIDFLEENKLYDIFKKYQEIFIHFSSSKYIALEKNELIKKIKEKNM